MQAKLSSNHEYRVGIIAGDVRKVAVPRMHSKALGTAWFERAEAKKGDGSGNVPNR